MGDTAQPTYSGVRSWCERLCPCPRGCGRTCWPGVGWLLQERAGVPGAPQWCGLGLCRQRCLSQGPIGLGGRAEGSRLPHPPGQLWAETGCLFLAGVGDPGGSPWADWDPAWQPLHLENSASLRPPPAGLWVWSVYSCPSASQRPLRERLRSHCLRPPWAGFVYLPGLGSLAWKLGQGHGPPGLPPRTT